VSIRKIRKLIIPQSLVEPSRRDGGEMALSAKAPYPTEGLRKLPGNCLFTAHCTERCAGYHRLESPLEKVAAAVVVRWGPGSWVRGRSVDTPPRLLPGADFVPARGCSISSPLPFSVKSPSSFPALPPSTHSQLLPIRLPLHPRQFTSATISRRGASSPTIRHGRLSSATMVSPIITNNPETRLT
jgi:hypothetical protein